MVFLLSVVSKCHTSALIARLHLWLEENAATWISQKLFYCTFGWRKMPQFGNIKLDFAITVLLLIRYLTVMLLLKKCLKMKAQNVIVVFADFRKAFDSVRHDKLSDCIRIQGTGEVVWCYWGYV